MVAQNFQLFCDMYDELVIKGIFFLFLTKLESKPVEFWNGIKSCKTDHSFQQQPKECIDFKKADWLHFASGCEAKKISEKKNSGVHGSQFVL